MREKINSSSGGTGTRILTFQYPKKSVDKRVEDCFSFHIFGQDFSVLQHPSRMCSTWKMKTHQIKQNNLDKIHRGSTLGSTRKSL